MLDLNKLYFLGFYNLQTLFRVKVKKTTTEIDRINPTQLIEIDDQSAC